MKVPRLSYAMTVHVTTLLALLIGGKICELLSTKNFWVVLTSILSAAKSFYFLSSLCKVSFSIYFKQWLGSTNYNTFENLFFMGFKANLRSLE